MPRYLYALFTTFTVSIEVTSTTITTSTISTTGDEITEPLNNGSDSESHKSNAGAIAGGMALDLY